MANIQNLYLLAQLVSSEEIAAEKLAESERKKNSEEIIKQKKELLELQKQISRIIKEWR